MNPEMEIGTDKRPSELIWTQASAARSILQAEISGDAVKSVRRQMEVFAHRRPDLYK